MRGDEAAHLDGAEQAKREHAAAVERSRQQAADYQRQLQAYNQGIAAGKYEAEQATAALINTNGFAPPPEKVDAAELAAWTSAARVILNLHETITRS